MKFSGVGCLLKGAHGKHMEAFAIGGGGTDKCTSNETDARAGSEHDVVGHTCEYGLPVDHQVPIVDRYLRSHRHLQSSLSKYQSNLSNFTLKLK